MGSPLYFFVSERLEMALQIMHYTLIVLILILFSKLTIDAIILGGFAVYFYQKYTELV